MNLPLLAAVVFPVLFAVQLSPRQEAAQEMEIQVASAMRAYYIEYGLPPGGTSLEIIHALTGGNIRKVVFIEFAPNSIGPDGSLLDPWGTPFRIVCPQLKFVEIRSAGPDKVFNTADDVFMRNPVGDDPLLNPGIHIDEFASAKGKSVDHHTVANEALNELGMLDSALDELEGKTGKHGVIASPEEVREFVKKGTRLYDALGDPAGPKDILGNPLGVLIIGVDPKVNPATARVLSDVAVGTFWGPFASGKELTPKEKAAQDVEIFIATATRNYQSEYGVPPTGTGVEIIQALTGTNPRKEAFIGFSADQLARDGGLLDPWGTPYHIACPQSKVIEIRSAGSDKIFNTADDIFLSNPIDADPLVNSGIHIDEYKPAPGETVDHLKAASAVREEMLMLDSAIDHLALKDGMLTGTIITPAQLRRYVKLDSRLYDALGDPAGPRDIMGNPIGAFVVDQIPKVNPATVKALSDVVHRDFWEPYIDKQ